MCQPLSLDFINTISFHPCETLQSKPCYYPYLTSEEVLTQRGEQVCQLNTNSNRDLWDLSPPGQLKSPQT